MGWIKPSPGSQASTRFGPGWLNLTYVCSRWRNLALNHPGLWSPNGTNEFGPQWMEIILERSMRTPLAMRFDLGRATADDMELIAKHMFHVSDITFVGRIESRSALFNVLTSPAPLLRAMRMKTEMSLPELSTQSWNNPIIWIPELPADMFSLQAPRLSELLLVDCFPPLVMPTPQILLGVQNLCITSWSSKFLKYKCAAGFHGGPNAASCYRLFAVLQLMKQLRMLALKYCFPPPRANNAPTDNSIIDLPYLQSLEIDDNVPESGVFLQRLRIPSTTQLSVHCDFVGDSRACLAVTSFIQAHMDAGSPPIQALSLILPIFHVSSHWTSLEVVRWRSTVTFPADSRSPGFAIAFTVSTSNRVRKLIGMIDSFTHALSLLSLTNVRTARYELPLETTWDIWRVRKAIQHVPDVKSLWVTGPGSADIADVLLPEQTGDGGVQSALTLPIPSLRMLGSMDVDLGVTRGSQLEPDYCKLRAGLQARKGMEGRALTLCIQECAMKSEWLEGLRKVANVEWDGKDIAFPDEMQSGPRPQTQLVADARRATRD